MALPCPSSSCRPVSPGTKPEHQHLRCRLLRPLTPRLPHVTQGASQAASHPGWGWGAVGVPGRGSRPLPWWPIQAALPAFPPLFLQGSGSLVELSPYCPATSSFPCTGYPWHKRGECRPVCVCRAPVYVGHASSVPLGWWCLISFCLAIWDRRSLSTDTGSAFLISPDSFEKMLEGVHTWVFSLQSACMSVLHQSLGKALLG